MAEKVFEKLKKDISFQVASLPDEEVAFRIVNLYFEEVAKKGFKEELDLDSITNAYFHVLKRLKNKEQELCSF